MWNIETYFLWFVFYSVVGWVYETLLCSFEAKQFVNRGFLNGPYCPIYGFGAVINALVLGRIDNPLMIFPAAVVLTTTLEYLTSLGMEKLFHARWWDYSDKKFNINGRVYLLGAIAFGSFSVIQLMWVQPWLVGIIEMIPNQFRSLSALILFSVLLVDTVYTVTKLSEFNREL
ncbi:MAG: putative ABC transporter permease [Clostridiaceae bacterium]